MSDAKSLGIGQLITTEQHRDAIHYAIAPVVCGPFDLFPGQHVRLDEDGLAILAADSAIGIVDPFLTVRVFAGQTFWLFLYPGSITSLRHDWTHPAFEDVPLPSMSKSEIWLRDFAKTTGWEYGAMMAMLKRAMEMGGACAGDDDTAERFNNRKAEVIAHASVVLGIDPVDPTDTYFSCAC